jgi:hypothetical protein
MVLRPEPLAVRYALPEAAAASQASAEAAVARLWEPAAALRAQAGLLWVAAVAVLLWAAAAVVRPAAAVRQQAAALRDVGRQRVARAAPWVFHPDRHLFCLPAPRPAGRFARAMRVLRIALP